MFETLLGGFMGGVFRLVPELLKWLDRKNERAHELAMQDKSLEFEKARFAGQLAQIDASSQAAWDQGTLTAFTESIKAQGQVSGVKWIDALSISVRPMITYWFMLIYCLVKAGRFWMIVSSGGDPLSSLSLLWTSDDMAIWAGLLNFWFLGRVFERARK
ncbi:MAG: hypothetical protein LBH14_06995 [Desulfobulbaceae bacterium]|jgi:hypothetical protein|nr:hypothetical protein [Desulfobulbaceae bacterium]